MLQLIYRGIDGRTKILKYDGPNVEANELSRMFAEKEGLPMGSFHLYHNDKLLSSSMESIMKESNDGSLISVTLHPLLVGGKGGFGSMLRAIGAQIEKTTNKEACRDLSGRRLRDINAEKRFKDWVAKQAQAQEEKDKKRKEKLEKLKQEPKIMFEDPNYYKSKEEIPQEIDEALEHGLKNEKIHQSLSNKRTDPFEMNKSVKKQKKNLWLGVDLSDDDSDLDGESDEENEKSQERADLAKVTNNTNTSEVTDSRASPIPSTSSENSQSIIPAPSTSSESRHPVSPITNTSPENSQQTSDCDPLDLGLANSQSVVHHA